MTLGPYLGAFLDISHTAKALHGQEIYYATIVEQGNLSRRDLIPGSGFQHSLVH